MNTDIPLTGISDRGLSEALLYPELTIGRVISQSKQLYRVAAPGTDVLARVSGRFSFEASSSLDYPVTGDFVLLESEGGTAVIRRVLPRTSLFKRKGAGDSHAVQPVAANADTAFICMGLDQNFNIRRLERYLSVAWDSGAVPVVVLTKSDLCADVAEMTAEAQGAAIGAEVIVTSSRLGGAAEALIPFITGKTVVFLGSSGVGKSTLINALAGEALMGTGETRGDGKGRHTTTSRELMFVCGGAVIDTPGMRELGIERADTERSFADIAELAALCRFRDCSHGTEPGCAVRAAVESGELVEERLQSYLKLRKESGYEGLSSKEIEKIKLDYMFGGKGGVKSLRKFNDKNK